MGEKESYVIHSSADDFCEAALAAAHALIDQDDFLRGAYTHGAADYCKTYPESPQVDLYRAGFLDAASRFLFLFGNGSLNARAVLAPRRESHEPPFDEPP